MYGTVDLEVDFDPWATSTKVNRVVLALKPRSYQHDLFKREPFTAAASHWVRIVASAVNAELPAHARASGVTLAPLPIEDLVAYVRHGRCPDPTDPMMLVPEVVWKRFLGAISFPCTRPNGVSPREQDRLLQYLGEVANYVHYLNENSATDPIAQLIGLETKPLTYNNIHSWFRPLPSLLRRDLTQPVAYDLLRAARAELLMRLACPVTAGITGAGEVWVRFAGLLEYRADRKRKALYVRILNKLDQMQKVAGTFDLYRPLASDIWLDAFLDHWLARSYLPKSMKIDKALRAWMRSCLVREIGRAKIRPMLRQALLEGFRSVPLIDPKIARLTMMALSPVRLYAVYNNEYNKTWHELDALEQIQIETPKLLHLYQLARQEHRIPAGSGIDDLKALMRDYGVSQRGWTLLCRHGQEFYKGLLRVPGFAQSKAIARHVILFQQVVRHNCPPLKLQSALYKTDIISISEIEDLPPQFIRQAWAELSSHEGRGTQEFFIRDELMPILRWLRQHRPSFDCNQLKAGWSFWSNSYVRWTDEKKAISEGRPLNTAFATGNIPYGAYVALPINSISGLIDEAESMHHCVVDYEDRCRSGEYLVLSIRERTEWTRIATLGLYRSEGFWNIDQISGYANKPVSLAIRRAASAITDRVNALSCIK